jgi:hypothetical protein
MPQARDTIIKPGDCRAGDVETFQSADIFQ